MNQLQPTDVMAGYRKATDAQQQIIDELRYEISILREQIEARDRHMNVCRGRTKCPADEVLAEWLKGFVRLYDQVVTGLVEAAKAASHGNYPTLEQRHKSNELCQKALSAYEERVKSIEPTLQNHGHMNIEYKYNNETTTMSPSRVKEVGK